MRDTKDTSKVETPSKKLKPVVIESSVSFNNPYSEDREIKCRDTGEICHGKEYLNTKHWRQLRKDLYCYRNGNCQKCHIHIMFTGARVHHLNYDSMGHEHFSDLMLLCDECHAEIHGRKSKRYWNTIVRERKRLLEKGEELTPEIVEAFDDLELRDTPDKYYIKEIRLKPSEKQKDFATAIAEMLGIDLPEEYTKEAYHDFIDDNIDEFYKVQNEIRYKDKSKIRFEHSYTLSDGYNGDAELNINPENL